MGARLLVRLRRAARHADGSRAGPDRRARSSTTGKSAGWPGCCASTARSATPTRIARAIVRARAREELVSTQQLVDVIKARGPVPAQFAGGHPARANLPGAADRGQRRAVPARRGAAGGVEGAQDRRAARGDLVPLARGPARQALPRRPRPRLRVPAGAPGVRVRSPPGSGAADPAGGRAHARARSRQIRARSRPTCVPPASWRATVR